MNSRNTTLPRKDDRLILWPVRPFGPTTGRVKSGAKLVDEAVAEVTVG